MTNANTQTNGNRRNQDPVRPNYVAKMRHGHGKNATFERIGVAWRKDDGSFYVKLHGTQIISDGFALYELQTETGE